MAYLANRCRLNEIDRPRANGALRESTFLRMAGPWRLAPKEGKPIFGMRPDFVATGRIWRL